MSGAERALAALMRTDAPAVRARRSCEEACVKWTEAMLRRLAALRAEGWSAASCAGQINNEFGTAFTRNAVLGICDRRGIPGAPGGQVTRGDKRQHAPLRRAWRPAPKPKPKPKPKPPAVAVDAWPTPADDAKIPLGQRRTLLTIGSGECRWPVGDVGADVFFFCGARADRGSPYCACHAARARPARAERTQAAAFRARFVGRPALPAPARAGR